MPQLTMAIIGTALSGTLLSLALQSFAPRRSRHQLTANGAAVSRSGIGLRGAGAMQPRSCLNRAVFGQPLALARCEQSADR